MSESSRAIEMFGVSNEKQGGQVVELKRADDIDVARERLAAYLRTHVKHTDEHEHAVEHRVDLTPDLAKLLLSIVHPRQREVSAQAVSRIVRDLLHYGGIFTGDAVIISSGGFAADGRHRCTAVIESGVTIPNVRLILLREDMGLRIIDNNKARTQHDIHKMFGSAVLTKRQVGGIKCSLTGGSGGRANEFSKNRWHDLSEREQQENPEALALYTKAPNALRNEERACLWRALKATIAVGGDTERTMKFFESMSRSDYTIDGYKVPALESYLRRWRMTDLSTSNSTTNVDRLRVVTRAWNAFVRGAKGSTVVKDFKSGDIQPALPLKG